MLKRFNHKRILHSYGVQEEYIRTLGDALRELELSTREMGLALQRLGEIFHADPGDCEPEADGSIQDILASLHDQSVHDQD